MNKQLIFNLLLAASYSGTASAGEFYEKVSEKKSQQHVVAEKITSLCKKNADEICGKEDVHSSGGTEKITILATSAPQHFTDLNTASSLISPTQLTIDPSTILDMLVEVPGVAENGQAGLFQVYSIRGLSRHRVLTYVSDIPLKAERRAGVSSSFLHPLLLEYAQVSRGPASTLYQSGSLGGVVKLSPGFFNSSFFSADYQTQGNRNSQIYGTGDTDWSAAIARQYSSNGDDVYGNELNNGYQQLSASFIKHWTLDGIDYEWMLLLSDGDDIGRSSTQYPERLVTVPSEQHLLSQFSAQGLDWRASIYFHPNEVETLTIRPDQRENHVINESQDYGFHFENSWEAPSLSIEGLWGVDGFQRANIDAKEQELSYLDNSVIQSQTLNGASEREIATFATVNKFWGDTKWQVGTRLINNRQSNQGSASTIDHAVTGFVGLSQPLNDKVLLTANVGTGVRFATVSERFYSGTTGRGEVIGNPELNKERALSFDLGLRYGAQDKQFSLNIYQQKVSNYIERIEVAPGLLTYRNLNSGVIYGAEFDSNFVINEQWQLGMGAMLVKGNDEDNNTLSDIPANRLQGRAQYFANGWSLDFSLQYRLSKDEFGSGEKATPAAWVGKLGFKQALSDNFDLSIFVDNAFDEEYFSSSDDVAPYVEGRSFGVRLTKRW
ncbi:TonB-dependent receptor [Kangiella sp.]|uniref:TonB-dependent receptor n=1 Tax=Kangiella sp. TaxID=1920245 RepID=UPI003A91E686